MQELEGNFRTACSWGPALGSWAQGTEYGALSRVGGLGLLLAKVDAGEVLILAAGPCPYPAQTRASSALQIPMARDQALHWVSNVFCF